MTSAARPVLSLPRSPKLFPERRGGLDPSRSLSEAKVLTKGLETLAAVSAVSAFLRTVLPPGFPREKALIRVSRRAATSRFGPFSRPRRSAAIRILVSHGPRVHHDAPGHRRFPRSFRSLGENLLATLRLLHCCTTRTPRRFSALLLAILLRPSNDVAPRAGVSSDSCELTRTSTKDPRTFLRFTRGPGERRRDGGLARGRRKGDQRARPRRDGLSADCPMTRGADANAGTSASDPLQSCLEELTARPMGTAREGRRSIETTQC